MSAAYDRLDREVMITEMMRLGFGGTTCKFLISMYSGDSIRFDINGETTEPLFMTYGVKQGDSFSSTLFNVTSMRVVIAANATRRGLEIGKRLLSLLAFADDKFSVTKNPQDHNEMLKLIGRECKQINMKINMEKSKLMRKGGGIEGEIIPELEEVKIFKYLGVEVEHKVGVYILQCAMWLKEGNK